MKKLFLLLAGWFCLPFDAHARRFEAEILRIDSHVPGLRLALRHKGPAAAAGDPILFLHGSSFPSGLSFDFPLDGVSWMDRLAAQGRDVYALDFLGYGGSDRHPGSAAQTPLPPGRAREAVRDVARAADFILARTGRARLVLIGHSWGGSVAAAYAAQPDARVARLVLYAAITARPGAARPGVARPDPPAPRAAYEAQTPAQRLAAMRGLAPGGRNLLAGEMEAGWGAAWLASDRRAPGQAVRYPAGPSADVADLLAGRAYYDPAAIAVPVLLVRGEWDAFPAEDDYRRLRAALVRAPWTRGVTVPGGTHVMHLERGRAALYAAVERFLDETP